MIVTLEIPPEFACDMNSLNGTIVSCGLANRVEKFQISTPTTTSTTQNNKLLRVEFKREPPTPERRPLDPPKSQD